MQSKPVTDGISLVMLTLLGLSSLKFVPQFKIFLARSLRKDFTSMWRCAPPPLNPNLANLLFYRSSSSS